MCYHGHYAQSSCSYWRLHFILDFLAKINVVGTNREGLRNVMVITDGDLKARGMVGNTRYYNGRFPGKADVPFNDAFGNGGQLQVVRNHPDNKAPMVGITTLRDADISLNLSLYLAESEQKSAVVVTDVNVEGNLCRCALGIMVERLPGVTVENTEKSIANLEAIEKKGLRSYLNSACFVCFLLCWDYIGGLCEKSFVILYQY